VSIEEGQLPPPGIYLRAVSPYLLEAYPLSELPPDCGGPPPDPVPGEIPVGYQPECDPMAPMIGMACAYLSSITCRDFGNGSGSEIPTEMLPLAYFATALYVEQLHYRMDPSRRTASMGGVTGGLRSFSVGPYSESYFGPGESAEYAWNVLDPDPLLNSMLMALITPECLEMRKSADGEAPGYATQEIDWLYPPGYGGGFWNCRGGDWLP
jgi:hypothetical protein